VQGKIDGRRIAMGIARKTHKFLWIATTLWIPTEGILLGQRKMTITYREKRSSGQ
jgi:hypothetical protein